MTEQRGICGFLVADSTCKASPTGPHAFCPAHEGLPCSGCGSRAIRQCWCAPVMLCPGCEHQPGNRHGRAATVRDTARADLLDALTLTLSDAVDKELCAIPERQRAELARHILDQLSMHIVLKVLSGMAQPPN